MTEQDPSNQSGGETSSPAGGGQQAGYGAPVPPPPNPFAHVGRSDVSPARQDASTASDPLPSEPQPPSVPVPDPDPGPEPGRAPDPGRAPEPETPDPQEPSFPSPDPEPPLTPPVEPTFPTPQEPPFPSPGPDPHTPPPPGMPSAGPSPFAPPAPGWQPAASQASNGQASVPQAAVQHASVQHGTTQQGTPGPQAASHGTPPAVPGPQPTSSADGRAGFEQVPWQPGQAPVVPPPVAQPLPFQQQPVFQQQPAQQPVGYAAGSNAPAGPGGYAYQGQGQGQGQGQAQGYPGGYSVPQASGQFAAPSAPGFGQQQYTAYAPATGGYQLPASYPVPQPRPKQPVLGLWAVIFGVIAVIGGVIFGWTLPFAVAAIVMGFVARKKELSYRGRALAAIITGFVGLVLSLGWLTYSFVVLFT